jgi:hypothetical protein
MENEFTEMAVKTPIFHGDRRVPPALIGTAEGWVNPEEICGITSGIHEVPVVADARNKKPQNQKPKHGGFMTVLHFHSGDRILVMGTPKELRQQIIQAVNPEVVEVEEEETAEEQEQPEAPAETAETETEEEPSQGEEEGGE